MTERTVRFNFTKRRAERGEQTRKAEERERELLRKTQSDAEALKRAIDDHFSSGEFTASRSGAVVKIERRGTGKVAAIKALGDKRYGVKTKDDFSFRIAGAPGEDPIHESVHEAPFDKELDEDRLLDWILDWSAA
jgi:uncharacterized sporulation protein YeaH/YhbH (DUF444 family)